MKKIISAYLIIVILLSVIPTTYAEDFSIVLTDEERESHYIETDAGTMEITGYSIIPNGFNGFSNDHKYDGYSIFTVHAVITIKGDEPRSSWMTFKTQAYQNGVDARRHNDFSKAVLIGTELLPDTKIEIDYDFLVESPDAPVTFMVSTWGKSVIVFQETVSFSDENDSETTAITMDDYMEMACKDGILFPFDSDDKYTLDIPQGTLILTGYSVNPQEFEGYSNDHKYDNYTIFTVHGILTIKGDEPNSSWSTFHTQAYQQGVDSRRHTDFSKDISIVTDIMPGIPVNIDYDFLVPSSEDPVTFIVQTWGVSQTIFKEEIKIS